MAIEMPRRDKCADGFTGAQGVTVFEEPTGIGAAQRPQGTKHQQRLWRMQNAPSRHVTKVNGEIGIRTLVGLAP